MGSVADAAGSLHFRLISQLPPELLHAVLEHLSLPDLCSFGRSSKRCHHAANPLIWREVELIDRETEYLAPDGTTEIDRHDDTPFLKKLITLAKNPWIGACVDVVTHRCYKPPPAVFDELPKNALSGCTLSSDPRTIALVMAAVTNMPNVRTLRIILGHLWFTEALIRSFFNISRKASTPVRRLWIETCCFSEGFFAHLESHPLNLPLCLDQDGLECIRLRRLSLSPSVLTRNVPSIRGLPPPRLIRLMKDGNGIFYFTEYCYRSGEPLNVNQNTLSRIKERDDAIFEQLDAEFGLRISSTTPDENSELWKAGAEKRDFMCNPMSLHGRDWNVLFHLFHSAQTTLTSICLDWICTRPDRSDQPLDDNARWLEMFRDFFKLRFPNLRAFQLRNVVTITNELPGDLCLLDHSDFGDLDLDGRGREIAAELDLAGLSFMEAHSNLQCLAWPMVNFFSGRSRDENIAKRAAVVVERLGRSLVDLRVDDIFGFAGEEHTDDDDGHLRTARRRFVSEFAAKMNSVESIKMEGGIPRDERREIIRALQRCPLQKIVMIGVNFPIGNTWRDGDDQRGENGWELMEDEDLEILRSTAFLDPKPPRIMEGSQHIYIPHYGWPPSPPLLHDLASHPTASTTITHLKFCGHRGAPSLFPTLETLVDVPANITHKLLLRHLGHFHALQNLVITLRLPTYFDHDNRDAEIVSYWNDFRNATSTALAMVAPQDSEPDCDSFTTQLETKLKPPVLAGHITHFLGPYLSERAKARPGGLQVRASFCMGTEGGIYDQEVWIGKAGMEQQDVCLGFEGPREELEPERRRRKLEERRWF